MNEFKKIVNNFINNSPISTPITDSTIYVVRDINNYQLSLVNTENGEEINIYVVDSKNKKEELNNKGIFSNIYQISKENLYSLNLGSNILIKNSQCIPYYGNVKIENPKTAAKLEDLYFSLSQEKNSIYSVCEISDEKIYLTDTKEGGYFSIFKDAYPDFKLGDLVKNVNGKYTLI